eukprot:Tbor_TRINITY_DN3942_c0_g1::TRINITY_DN3942_c0_g1_i1::g.762::m.762
MASTFANLTPIIKQTHRWAMGGPVPEAVVPALSQYAATNRLHSSFWVTLPLACLGRGVSILKDNGGGVPISRAALPHTTNAHLFADLPVQDQDSIFALSDWVQQSNLVTPLILEPENSFLWRRATPLEVFESYLHFECDTEKALPASPHPLLIKMPLPNSQISVPLNPKDSINDQLFNERTDMLVKLTSPEYLHRGNDSTICAFNVQETVDPFCFDPSLTHIDAITMEPIEESFVPFLTTAISFRRFKSLQWIERSHLEQNRQGRLAFLGRSLKMGEGPTVASTSETLELFHINQIPHSVEDYRGRFLARVPRHLKGSKVPILRLGNSSWKKEIRLSKITPPPLSKRDFPESPSQCSKNSKPLIFQEGFVDKGSNFQIENIWFKAIDAVSISGEDFAKKMTTSAIPIKFSFSSHVQFYNVDQFGE